MKQILTLFAYLLFFPMVFIGQQYTHVYYMDESFNSVQKEKAVITCKGFKDTAGFKLDCFTVLTNVPVLSAAFTDSSIGTLNGQYSQYYDSGILQSKGYYLNNLKHGVWEEYNEWGKKTDSAFYDSGIRKVYAHYDYYHDKNKAKTKIYSFELKDSFANTLDKYFFSDSGKLVSKVHFTGARGIWESYDKGVTSVDTVYTREENEAHFPGDNSAWTTFLEKSLGSFNPAMNGAPKGIYRVIIKFIVDIDGSISDVVAETNFGYEMEKNALRVINKSPKWVPATRFGKPLKAYRSQPITFLVEEQ